MTKNSFGKYFFGTNRFYFIWNSETARGSIVGQSENTNPWQVRYLANVKHMAQIL
jgi:predicted branched-subunit amino acid permease